MATTIRDQIIKALLARLRTLYPSAERQYIRLLEADLPAACLWDGAEAGVTAHYGRQTNKLQINIAAAERLAVNDNFSKIGNELLGQIIKTIIATDPTLSGLAVAVRYQNSDIKYPEPGGDWIIGVDVGFEVEYQTILGNPYQ